MKSIRQFLEIIRIARKSLRANGLRTLLTMLGIAVGIFVITAIFTFVDSMVYELEAGISSLGDRVIFVHKFPWTMDTSLDWRKLEQRRDMRYSDFHRLTHQLELADAISYQGNRRIKAKNEGISVSGLDMIGITEDFGMLNDFEFQLGRPLSAIEFDRGRNVAILGANVAKQLFPKDDDATGLTFRTEGKKMKVIGVLKAKGGDIAGNSPDDDIFVPYNFIRKSFQDNEREMENLIAIRAKNRDELDLLESEVIGVMRAARGLRPRQENDFSINKPENLMAELGKLSGSVKFGGFIISIFSILVGGFGIGNIMFTSVKERTFEIGLQKSLGATRGFILWQFLVESVMLCLLGGIIGLAFTWGVGQVVELILAKMEMEMKVVMSTFTVIFAVSVSVMIGLLSGIIPSAMAARLNPVDSMRSK